MARTGGLGRGGCGGWESRRRVGARPARGAPCRPARLEALLLYLLRLARPLFLRGGCRLLLFEDWAILGGRLLAFASRVCVFRLQGKSRGLRFLLGKEA